LPHSKLKVLAEHREPIAGAGRLTLVSGTNVAERRRFCRYAVFNFVALSATSAIGSLGWCAFD
jgi:hypothetical protein